MRWAVVLVAGAVWIASASASAIVRAPDVPALVERVHAYLDAYEPVLSALVAEETFEQRLTEITDYRIVQVVERRQLVSDVGFLRLPGGHGWLGQRSVRTVDRRPLPTAPGPLDQVFAAAGTDILRQARDIAAANARFNLGHPRSINVPTLPLDLLGRRRADAFEVTAAGTARAGGQQTTILRWQEREPGGLIAFDGEQFARTEVQAWVSDDGAVLRADVILRAPASVGGHEIRVDFATNRTLNAIVPVRLTEKFSGRLSGDGVATYRNYRRFTTGARLVPPQ